MSGTVGLLEGMFLTLKEIVRKLFNAINYKEHSKGISELAGREVKNPWARELSKE